MFIGFLLLLTVGCNQEEPYTNPFDGLTGPIDALEYIDEYSDHACCDPDNGVWGETDIWPYDYAWSRRDCKAVHRYWFIADAITVDYMLCVDAELAAACVDEMMGMNCGEPAYDCWWVELKVGCDE
jgi:hypothetical protein